MPELKQILPLSSSKSNENSSEEINQRIERRIEANVGYFKQQSKEDIRQRIIDLEREWDIERMFEINMAAVALLSSFLSIKANKKWSYLAGAASIFIIQQAAQGWSPPLVIFRRMGIRTAEEINLEKMALQELLDKPQ